MVIRPARRESLADSIFAQLRESILSGALTPGDALPGERALAEQLQANRGAVREALKRLAQARLVETRQGGATRVLDFRSSATVDIIPQLLRRDGRIDLAVARSMIELRATITPDMTRLAVMRRKDQLSLALRTILAEMRASSVPDARLQELTDEFWSVIAKNSENIAYRLILNTITEVRRISSELLSAAIPAQYRDLSHLERIVRAAEVGDADAAFEAARERTRMMAGGLAASGAKPG